MLLPAAEDEEDPRDCWTDSTGTPARSQTTHGYPWRSNRGLLFHPHGGQKIVRASAGRIADLMILSGGLSVTGCSEGSVRAGPGGAPEACMEFAERQGYDTESALLTQELLPQGIPPDGTVQVVVFGANEQGPLVCYTRLDRGAWWLIGFSGVPWPLES